MEVTSGVSVPMGRPQAASVTPGCPGPRQVEWGQVLGWLGRAGRCWLGLGGAWKEPSLVIHKAPHE